MNDFIAKPINPEALIETLSRLVKPKQQSENVDTATESVTVLEGDALVMNSLPVFAMT
jgi:YesN/AraC family two-component response regulator